MAVSFDPGVGEGEVGEAAKLAVGEVERQIPGTPEQIAVRKLHLTKHTLALAVAETA